MRDAYDVLGVAPDSEDVVIRGAYTALIRKYHPDVFSGDPAYAEAKTKEINGAFDSIRDPKRRTAYDARRGRREGTDNRGQRSQETGHAGSTKPPASPKPPSPPSRDFSSYYMWAGAITFVVLIFAASLQNRPIATSTSTATSPPAPTVVRSAAQLQSSSAAPQTLRASADAPELHDVPAKIEWNAKDSGDPKTYVVGYFKLVLSTGHRSDGFPVPVLDADYVGMSHLRLEGQAGFEVADAKIEVLKLDPRARNPALLFITYSGGAHCCTTVDIYEPMRGMWRHAMLGGDGEPLSALPKDIDGDGIPDIVMADDSFL